MININNVEVFYPGEYSQVHYDGSCPKNGWQRVAPRLQKHPIFYGIEKTTTIPINMIRHVTHSEQAGDIKRQTCYTFKPRAKYGKAYDSEKEGSYKKVSENTFQKLQQDERVIEGNLSWWGVDTYSWYYSGDVHGRAFGLAAERLRKERVFVSPFISNPRESPYGRHGFIVNLKNLLKYYKQSRTGIVNIRDRALFLRVGGTLRYRFEICYVVIVCTKHDHELECYPSLYTQSAIFDHKGLLFPSGRIKRKFFESQETIDFKPQYVIKCVPQRQYSSYEAPAFAFYYPETSTISSLKCPKEVVTEVQTGHRCNKLCEKKNQIYFEELWDSIFTDD